MLLLIRSTETNEIYPVRKFEKLPNGQDRVWASSWPGKHTVGLDCQWIEVSEKEWGHISFIRENPELTMRKIAKQTGISYARVFRMVKRFHLTVKIEKVRGILKGEQYWKKYCGLR